MQFVYKEMAHDGAKSNAIKCLKWRKLTLELQINLQNPKLERLNEVDKSNLKDKCGKYLHSVN